jgi:hypothetical protein
MAVGYDGAMKSPKVGKPRSASGAFTLSRSLPKLQLPVSAPRGAAPRPKPSVGKPNAGKPNAGKPNMGKPNAGKPSPAGGVKGGRNG